MKNSYLKQQNYKNKQNNKNLIERKYETQLDLLQMKREVKRSLKQKQKKRKRILVKREHMHEMQEVQDRFKKYIYMKNKK